MNTGPLSYREKVFVYGLGSGETVVLENSDTGAPGMRFSYSCWEFQVDPVLMANSGP